MALALDRAAPGLDAFRRWWLGELRGLLPAPSRRTARPQNAVILLYDRRLVTAAIRRGRKLKEIGSLTLPEPRPDGSTLLTRRDAEQLRLLQKAVRAAKLPVYLRLQSGMGLVTEDVLPPAAESEVGQIMAHKIDILTPWTAEQVHFDQRVTGRKSDGRLVVTLVVVPRQVVAEVRRRLSDLGLAPTALDLVEDDPWAPPTLDLLGAGIHSRRGSGWSGLLAWLLLLALCVGAAAAAHRLYGQNRLIEQRRQLALGLEQRLADLPQLRQALDAMRLQAGFMTEQQGATPSPVVVLEVLSRLLPDTVWLTELSLDGEGLQISGYADDPPSLLALLEGSPHFFATRFTAPSTRETVPTTDGGERETSFFSIACKVSPSRDPVP